MNTQNDWFIKRTQAPKTGMYPLIKGAYLKASRAAKGKGVTPYAHAIKFSDSKKAKQANLMYLKNRNIDLGTNINSIELAILAHAERLKDLQANIPAYRSHNPELFTGVSDLDMLKSMVVLENDLEENEKPKTMHWGMIPPEVMAANQVIYDANFDTANASVILLPEVREVLKNKSVETAERFNNFDWGSILDTGIKTGANIVAPGSGALIDKSGISFKGLTNGKPTLSNKNDGKTTWIPFGEYWKGGKRFGQPVVRDTTNPKWYDTYKKDIERFMGGISYEQMMDDFMTVDQYNRPFLNNGLQGVEYWNSIAKEAARIRASLTPAKTEAVQKPILPTSGGAPNLPEIGNIKWGKDGISWGVTNNKATMIYYIVGAAVLVVILFLLMRRK